MMIFMRILGKVEKMSGYLMFNTKYYQSLLLMLVIQKNWKNNRIWDENSSNLLSSANKYFNNFGNENDEPIYIYCDKYMRWFVRRAVKGR